MTGRDGLSVSVVIATHNRRDELPALLDAVAAEPAVEIVVVVNACEDGSLELLEQRAQADARVKPLFLATPGQMLALQAGVEQATGDVVLLLDDDVLPEPGLIAGHAARHEACAGLVVLGYMPVALPERRRRGQYPRYLYAADYERTCAEFERNPDAILPGLWAGNVSLRRADCLRVGLLPSAGMPAGYGYHEDREFGLRCQASGLRGAFDRTLRATHRYAKTPTGFRAAARNSGTSTAALHAIHAEAVGALATDFARGASNPASRLIVWLAGTRLTRAPIVAGLRALAALAGSLRRFRLETHAGHLIGSIERQRGAREGSRQAASRDAGRPSHGSIAGLAVSSVALLLTLVVVTGVGPPLPGPPIRDWLGLGEPDPILPCQFDPAKVRHPTGVATTGEWQQEPPLPFPSSELDAVGLDRYAYLVGGQNPGNAARAITRFDPGTGRYRRVGLLPIAIDHATVTALDGELIVASGYAHGSDATGRTWAFSPRTGAIRELEPMNLPRGAAAAAVLGDRLYVSGGTWEYGNGAQPRDSLEIYDASEGRWTNGADMGTPRHHFGAAAVDGKIYFVGGRSRSDLSLNTVESYDPQTDDWQRLPALPVGAGSLDVTAVDGRVIAIGGGEDGVHIGEGKWVLRTAYAFDPHSNRWTRLTDMGRPRHGLAAATVDGDVYAFGGIPCPDYGRMASTESLELR